MTKGRIIVVEDEMIVARDIQSTLIGFGYEVPEIVASGEAAIQAAFRLQPDLMLMDIMIKGGMDGIDAAEIIRSQFNIPVIYLTAYSDDETLRRAKLTESYGFISKPFDERELFVAVEFALYRHQVNDKILESRDWMEALVRALPEALVAIDKDNKVVMLNARAESLLALKEYEAKGAPIESLLCPTLLSIPEGEVGQIGCRTRFGADIALWCRPNLIRDEKGLQIGKVFSLSRAEV